MTIQFLDLPLELRLKVYSMTFGDDPVILDGGRQDVGISAAQPCLLPAEAVVLNHQGRSAQLLRTCKTVLNEARPILYTHTRFQTITEAFAGKLPTHFTTAHPAAKQVRSLTWQLSCDMLKKLYTEDIKLDHSDFPNLQNLELRCQAENWRGTICDDSCNDEIFARGRQQIIDYAKIMQSKMSSDEKAVRLVEDRKSLSKGRVILNLTQAKHQLSADELEIP